MAWEGYTSRVCKCNDFNVNGVFARDTPSEPRYYSQRQTVMLLILYHF